MSAGKFLALVAGIITLLGTYFFAISGVTGTVGSGIGFITNLSDLFSDAETSATDLDTPLALYYVYVILFIIFLASGVLQMLSICSRAVGFIFSLFPLCIGIMFILLGYTELLGDKSLFFSTFFNGEQYGDFFPILVDLGELALGTYILLAGGVLGVICVFIERD